MIRANTTLQDLQIMAVAAICEVETNEEFIVRDLFRGFEWNRIPKGYRTKLGSLFLNYAQGEGSSKLEILGKTPQNQQIYRKK